MVAEPRASVLKQADTGKQSKQIDAVEKENEAGAALLDQANPDGAKGQKKPQKMETPYSHIYPVDPSKMTADHMQMLRSLAVQRMLNADIAKYAVMNVAYGVKNLESYLHGRSLRKASYAETGTKAPALQRSVEVKMLWNKAIRKVMNRNRFINNTKHLSKARRSPPEEPIMGYMITNFNHITFEDGNVLELCLDWFDAYTALTSFPNRYLSTLIQQEKERHRSAMLRAEKHNRKLKETESKKDKSSDALGKGPKAQCLHVVPWDEAATTERLKYTSLQFKALQEVSQLAASLGACNERISAKARSIMTRVCKICSVDCPPLVTLEQAKASLGSQLEAMKVYSFTIDGAQEVLLNPTAEMLDERKKLEQVQAQVDKTNALNKLLHEDIRTLNKLLEDANEEAARKYNLHRKQVEALQLKIAEMQMSADLGGRQIEGLQARLQGLQEEKRQLESCLDDLVASQETSDGLRETIRHLEEKNSDLNTRLQASKGLRDALSVAQSKLAEGEQLQQELITATREVKAMKSKVKEMELRVNEADQLRARAAAGIDAEVVAAKQGAEQAKVQAQMRIAEALGEAAEESASSSLGLLEPLGDAGSIMSASEALGIVSEALQGDFVQAADMRCNLWRIVDAVDVAAKVMCAAEYERGHATSAADVVQLRADVQEKRTAVSCATHAALQTLQAALRPQAVEEGTNSTQHASLGALQRLTGALGDAVSALENLHALQGVGCEGDTSNAVPSVDVLKQGRAVRQEIEYVAMELKAAAPQVQSNIHEADPTKTQNDQSQAEADSKVNLLEAAEDTDTPSRCASAESQGKQPSRTATATNYNALSTAPSHVTVAPQTEPQTAEQLNRIIEAAQNLCSAQLTQQSSPEELQNLVSRLRTALNDNLQSSVVLAGTPATEAQDVAPLSSEAMLVSSSHPRSNAHLQSSTMRAAPVSPGGSQPHESLSQGSYSPSESGATHTSMGHMIDHDDSFEGNADRETDGSCSDRLGSAKIATQAQRTHSAVTRSQSGAADEVQPVADSSTAAFSRSHRSGIQRSSSRKSTEREEELLQKLDDECKAHEATQRELDATEEALEAVTAAVNQAADEKLEAALEVASIRKQLAQWNTGTSNGKSDADGTEASETQNQDNAPLQQQLQELQQALQAAMEARDHSIDPGAQPSSQQTQDEELLQRVADAEQRSAELAEGAMLALTAALGPLPLSPDDLTPSVMNTLAEDINAVIKQLQHDADRSVVSRAVSAIHIPSPNGSRPSSSTSWRNTIDAGDNCAPAASGEGSGELGDLDPSLPDIGRERFKSRVTFRHSDDTGQATGLLPRDAEEGTTFDEDLTALERDNDSRAMARQNSQKGHPGSSAHDSTLKIKEVEEEGDHATQRFIVGRKGFGYSSNVEVLDMPLTHAPGRVGHAFLREPLDCRMRRHREEYRHACALAAVLQADAATGTNKKGTSKYVAQHGVGQTSKDWSQAGWVGSAARGGRATNLAVVEHAPGCPALPWRVVTPESKVPEQLAARARKIAEGVRSAIQNPPCGLSQASGKKQQPRSSLARLNTSGQSTTLHSEWLRQAGEQGNNAAFLRMHEELTQLNALYARALAQAAALMHARRVGSLSDGAAAAMHAVEGSVMAETMAAMDVLNDLEPLQLLADTRPEPQEPKEAERKLSARSEILQQLKAEAARTTACLEGTAFLERNRAAFEKSLCARATATATARAAAEARLRHTKRVDRSSTFLSDASVSPTSTSSPHPKSNPMRKASNLFQHNSIFRSLYDPACAPRTPPITHVCDALAPVSAANLGFKALPCEVSAGSLDAVVLPSTPTDDVGGKFLRSDEATFKGAVETSEAPQEIVSIPSVESTAAALISPHDSNAGDTMATQDDTQSSIRTGNDLAGPPVAWNTNAACPPMRRPDRVNLHGMHKSPSRLPSARARSSTAEPSPRDLPVRPATQGGASVVGKGLGIPNAMFSSDSTVATKVPAALPGMRSMRTTKVAALAASAEDEGLSAWVSMRDGHWEEGSEQDVGASRPSTSASPSTNIPGGKSPRLQGKEGFGGASHRMVVGAAASAAKKRQDSTS